MDKEIHQAIILVGGYGTRLRPLTLTRPKSLIDFANKPIIVHQIEALVNAGVKNIILAVSHQAEQVEKAILKEVEKLSVTIIFSYETEPLGTAGAIALAGKYLTNCNSFFVLNSDVICNFPFKDLIKFHKFHGKEGTLVVTKVNEPSKYGVVVFKDNCIEEFVEKPRELVSNKINAGLYIFNRDILNRMEIKRTSIEKDVFPIMAVQQQLMAFELNSFWMDIGQPQDYLTGISLYLEHLKSTNPNLLYKKSGIVGTVLVDPTAIIGKNCQIGPSVTIGTGVVIEDGVCIKRSAILRNSVIQSNSYLKDCIIGWNCNVGKWVRMEGPSVLADNVTITDECYINNAFILPFKNVVKSIFNYEIVM